MVYRFYVRNEEINRLTEAFCDILALLFQREVEEFIPKTKLPVHAILRNIEVLHVEETLLADGLDESLGELLLSLRSIVKAKVHGNEISPI